MRPLIAALTGDKLLSSDLRSSKVWPAWTICDEARVFRVRALLHSAPDAGGTGASLDSSRVTVNGSVCSRSALPERTGEILVVPWYLWIASNPDARQRRGSHDG